MHRSSLAIVAAFLIAGSAGAAQPPSDDETLPPASEGVRVRVRIRDGKWLAGRLVSVNDATLGVAADGHPPTIIARDAIERFEVSRGRKRNGLRGFAIGAAPGAAFGIWWCTEMPCNEVEGAALGLYTAAIGAAIGSLIKTERWEARTVGSVDVIVARSRGGGVSAAVAIKF